jgi:putative transposase
MPLAEHFWNAVGGGSTRLRGNSVASIQLSSCRSQPNFNSENFWARGYAVSTVGFELEAVRHYIREQETADKGRRF